MEKNFNITNIYKSFEDINISEDIKKSNAYVSENIKLLSNKIDIHNLEKILLNLNNTSVLINKLYSYSYLNLYLNTKNQNAQKLINKVNFINKSFKLIEAKLGKKLSLDIINRYSTKSMYILEHKFYLNNLISSNSICDFNYNSNLEYTYNEKSSKKININNTNYSINKTIYDLIFDKSLNDFSFEYLKKRELFFCENSDFFSNILTQIKKESICLASNLGYDSPLQMSFSNSGLNYKNISILINSIKDNKYIFNTFINTNSEYINYNKKYSKNEIKNIILNSFSKFHPSLFDFSKKMFDNNFMDFDYSENKFNGTTHLKVLSLKESRIIGQPSDNIKSIFQIAHEIGHAYQCNLIMNSKTALNCEIPNSICEIISILCELLVFDYLLDTVTDTNEKKYILFYFINYFMQALLDVYSRFIFEHKIFELVKDKSNLNFTILNNIMAESQQNAYSNYKYVDKFLWIYKPHFYSISTPYYNYPYAFGLLYSIIIFLQYKKCESNFYENFVQFCINSGCMSINNLSEYFNINLSDTYCYTDSYNYIKKIIDLYFN